MQITAAAVCGDKIQLHQNTTVYLGYIGSPNNIIWQAGRITPTIYSYVVQGGQVYWEVYVQGQSPLYQGDNHVAYIAHRPSMEHVEYDGWKPTAPPQNDYAVVTFGSQSSVKSAKQSLDSGGGFFAGLKSTFASVWGKVVIGLVLIAIIAGIALFSDLLN